MQPAVVGVGEGLREAGAQRLGGVRVRVRVRVRARVRVRVRVRFRVRVRVSVQVGKANRPSLG